MEVSKAVAKPITKDSTDEELLAKFDNLIWYAANMYKGISCAVDVDDLHQDGVILLLETWRRDDLVEEARVPHFKKSLFFLLRSKAYKQSKLSGELRPTTTDGEEGSINLGEIFATTDVQVLSEIYALEFVAEMRKMLGDEEARVFNFMIDPVLEEQGEITRKGDWIPAVAKRLGHTQNELYYICYKIRKVAKNLVGRFFPEVVGAVA